jgi:hypothetical protein
VRFCFLFTLLISLGTRAQNSFPPIGLWREHLPYQNSVSVAATEKKIYCATPYSLFSVQKDTKEIERMSRVSGLSETGISTMEFDSLSKKLIVAYSSSNLDLIDEEGVHNLPDLERKNISGDKTIYNIFTDYNLCYLSTGLGIIIVDENKVEIKDSWFIGQGGSYVKTNAFTKNGGFYYAATEEGLKKISTSNSNPALFSNWSTVSGSNGLSSAPCRSVVNLGGRTLALQHDSIFLENGTSWTPFFSNGSHIVSINVSEGKLFVSETLANGTGQVIVLNAAGSIITTLARAGIISFPQEAIASGNDYWVADLYGGLSEWTGNNAQQFIPNSPFSVSSGAMTVYNNSLYATAGSVNESWNYQYNANGYFRLLGNDWLNYNKFGFPAIDTMLDFITVAIDPRDESMWAGSYGGGLLHVKENYGTIFKQNSPIGPTIGDPTSYRVAGLAFDRDNNLWISNFGSDHQLRVLKNDGTWQSFSAPFSLNVNAAAQIVIDDANQKWIVSPLNNGLIVFNDNQSIDNLSDDKWKLYRSGAGQGNLPSNEVLCVAKDKSGFMWVGTADGIAVIPCPQEAVKSGCEAILPVITDGNFAGYLFKGQEVRSIAVDGADRKWVATSSGVWLISPEGSKVLEHFTEESTPLLSNDLKNVAINGSTGEVFFATAKGISSYRAAATEAAETKGKVLVFPNPVPPAYNGGIGIRGLPENSIVKITETNGRLVYQTRSLGGQATWNGKDYAGRQASSGIYLVLAEDESRQEKVVAKIVFVSR